MSELECECGRGPHWRGEHPVNSAERRSAERGPCQQERERKAFQRKQAFHEVKASALLIKVVLSRAGG